MHILKPKARIQKKGAEISVSLELKAVFGPEFWSGDGYRWFIAIQIWLYCECQI